MASRASDSVVGQAYALDSGAADLADSGGSAEGMPVESQRQHSSLSEGVASAGPPQPVVDECGVTAAAGAGFGGGGGAFQYEPPAGAAVAGYQGETSGGYGETGGAGPMEEEVAAACGSGGGALPGSSKCKSYMGEVSAEAGGPPTWLQQHADDRAPTEGGAATAPRAPDACDSNQSLRAQPDGSDDANRPSDADIIAWENSIRGGEARTRPLVGEREPLTALEAEYASGAAVFAAKLVGLRATYAALRRTRGDGNCFYRAFLFAYLEGLLAGGPAATAERDRAVARLQALRQPMVDCGYDEIVLEYPLDVLLGMLRAMGAAQDPLPLKALESNMRADDTSNYLVFLLRMLTSAEIKRRADFFAPFVIGLAGMDVESFCRKCVDPLGEEADHVQLVALADALEVPIRVVYLDRSGPGGDAAPAADTHDFVPGGDGSGGGAAGAPWVHLLYRPGHYDILYPA